MDLQNIPAVYPESAAPQPQTAPTQQQAAAMAQAAQAQQIAGMAQAGAAAQAAMPVSHRPMRQAGRQLRSTTQLHAVVEACQTVRIACVDEEGPFIVPMSFGYDWADPEEIDADAPRLALWVHSAGVGRKVDAFNREPRVAIEMDVQEGLITGTYACAYSYAYRSIMGTGTIHRIQGIEAKRYGLTRIMQHLAPEASTDFTDQALARANIYCIDIDRFTGKQRAWKAISQKRKRGRWHICRRPRFYENCPLRAMAFAPNLLAPSLPACQKTPSRKPFCVCKLPTIAPDTRSEGLCSRPTRRGRCRRSCR